MRKHRNQMKAAEIAALETYMHTVTPAIHIDHAAERMQQKNVTTDEIAKAIRFGKVVEFHNEAAELRVVMRLDFGRPKVAVCAVVEPKTAKVVTTWKNSGSDNHSTIDMSAYGWKADARQVFGLEA